MTIIQKFLYKINKYLISDVILVHKTFDKKLIKVGSEKAGWYIVDDKSLKNAIVFSAGLGEEASFDIEMINIFNASVIAIDPTPRAIDHYNYIMSNINNTNGIFDYLNELELDKITDKNFKLIQKALWKDNTKIEFYAPPNNEHVSHSIIDFQNNYMKKGPKLVVDALKFSKLISELDIKINEINLLKLDIEGAEIEVIESMLDDNIFPRQLCVEFDELARLSFRARKRVRQTHNKLLKHGYKCIKKHEHNYLYINF